ncbi:hypothetical protein LTR91_003876 [Friedmanniomyces endolithicus]|uniref:Myb-like domain-containing protein n=1 Tax=Friedmanniomyces endolithicus TaxID=329885 RepID=A0AAN6FUD4_9PEZI|nr:hypothetical protein LTR35_007330 [Friedmanniomyces endolithicus]KAK0297358.1 hypothetical protein LTS00_004080 [Friedmanniomyces endolithicus]KAK0315503.1 hypothetical protein LTR01_000802 [Friedmanniomyces endolithicus]KAK0323005.1 hypothetical protein LTR82_005934 [Friedmanniomyces endolithicus]KAK0827003.1 hypothetical protein LTR73_005785 [Friedmanniomyces endolithicus]
MPKEIRPSMTRSMSTTAVPYPAASTTMQRNAAIWSVADDEILLQARASGLNWQPISTRHFPNKTANACRKRHERLIERRHVEDWDAQKLELLAQEYALVRKEMWDILASRCMEKGLKSLQSTARTAQRRASANHGQASFDERGTSEHNSDSGIGLGNSDAEMEAGDAAAKVQHGKSASWHAHEASQHSSLSLSDHIRSRSLPQPLPLYQPPPPIISTRRTFEGEEMTASPEDAVFPEQRTNFPNRSRCSPDSNGRCGISIQSMLTSAEPKYPGGVGSFRRAHD